MSKNSCLNLSESHCIFMITTFNLEHFRNVNWRNAIITLNITLGSFMKINYSNDSIFDCFRASYNDVESLPSISSRAVLWNF